MIEVKGKTIYAGNKVDDTLIKVTNHCLEVFDEIQVCFDVMGRTKHLMGRTTHQMLAQELYSKLDNEKYEAEITCNYGCLFKRKEQAND